MMPLAAFSQIKWKLTLLIMSISVVIVALGGAAVVLYDAISAQRHFISRIDTLAEITAANSSAAVAFRDEADALRVLTPLGQRADIDFAGLFYTNGARFVSLPAEVPASGVAELLNRKTDAHRMLGQRLLLQRRVYFDNDVKGFVLLVANRTAESTRARAFFFIATAAMAGLVAVALLLATRLQRLVTEPIAKLAGAAHEITRRQDYSIRVPRNSNDEVGRLVDAFNAMLAEIERQNRYLVESDTRLKLALTASKMGIWEWELRTGQIHCSEETRLIFGCPTSEATLSQFTQLLHPEDADRVLKSLRVAVDSGGMFAGEYRVITPTNRLVWVLHVGRLQSGPDGAPAVLAGIVQDVTFRKHVEIERQKLVANLLHAEEEERRRIARELHDTTAQHLAALKMNCLRLFESARDQVLATQSRQLIDQALQELRTLTYVLHPPVLEEFGLAGAIADFAAGITRRTGIRVSVDTEAYQGRAEATNELALFRVLQESVTNAVRHSGTTEVQVQLSRNPIRTQLTIRDFGQGFHLALATPLEHAGVGIGSMKERMALVGGELTVESTAKGVTVIATVPEPQTLPRADRPSA